MGFVNRQKEILLDYEGSRCSAHKYQLHQQHKCAECLSASPEKH